MLCIAQSLSQESPSYDIQSAMSQYIYWKKYSSYRRQEFHGMQSTVKILNIGTCMSEQTVKILIRLLLRSSLIRIYTVCHSFYIFWRHYFIVKLHCFILRTTTVAGLGVPIFRVFTVLPVSPLSQNRATVFLRL